MKRSPEKYLAHGTPTMTAPQVHPITGEQSNAGYDLAMIYELAKMGCSVAEIGRLSGAPYDVLRDEPYKELIEHGRANLNKDLRGKQIEVALNGDVAMLKWLGQIYLKQVATERTVVKMDFSRLTDDELQRYLTSLEGGDPDQASLFE